MEKLREAGLSDVIFHQLEITDAPSVSRLADFLKIRFRKLEKLTEERLNKILQMFLNDFKADKVEAHRWPKDFSAYKVTLNAYTRIMASRHPELRINCAHPGCVKTDMTIRSGLLTPEEGASNLVKVALLRAYFDLGHKAPFM